MANTIHELNLRLENVDYDKGYQDIEVINMIGYDPSYPTWDRIMNELKVDFNNKTVSDLGCFHGYFSIKAKEAGASSVIGLDRYDIILDTSRMIVDLSNVQDVSFQIWVGGQPTPYCDIALVLNVLHHCGNEEETLENIQCEYAVFEINAEQVLTVQKYFNIIKMVEGRRYANRPSRLLVHAKKIS